MDVFYYSNYCAHSKKVIEFLAKGGFTDSLSCICIDKRKRNPNTNQTVIYLENGQQAIMPPNIQSVPALLLVNQKYKMVLGTDIIRHFEPMMKDKLASANFGNGEPLGYSIAGSGGGGGCNVVSEQFTYYNMTPEELSAKGQGGRRQLYNYVPASQPVMTINTPEDKYRPDKVDSEVTIDKIQQQRNTDVPQQNQAPIYEYKQMNTGF